MDSRQKNKKPKKSSIFLEITHTNKTSAPVREISKLPFTSLVAEQNWYESNAFYIHKISYVQMQAYIFPQHNMVKRKCTQHTSNFEAWE